MRPLGDFLPWSLCRLSRSCTLSKKLRPSAPASHPSICTALHPPATPEAQTSGLISDVLISSLALRELCRKKSRHSWKDACLKKKKKKATFLYKQVLKPVSPWHRSMLISPSILRLPGWGRTELWSVSVWYHSKAHWQWQGVGSFHRFSILNQSCCLKTLTKFLVLQFSKHI